MVDTTGILRARLDSPLTTRTSNSVLGVITSRTEVDYFSSHALTPSKLRTNRQEHTGSTRCFPGESINCISDPSGVLLVWSGTRGKGCPYMVLHSGTFQPFLIKWSCAWPI